MTLKKKRVKENILLKIELKENEIFSQNIYNGLIFIEGCQSYTILSTITKQ